MVSSLPPPFHLTRHRDQFYFQSVFHLDLSIPMLLVSLKPSAWLRRAGWEKSWRTDTPASACPWATVPRPDANLAFLENSLNWLAPCIRTSGSSQSLLNQVYIPVPSRAALNLPVESSLVVLCPADSCECRQSSCLQAAREGQERGAYITLDLQFTPVQLGRWDKFKKQ